MPLSKEKQAEYMRNRRRQLKASVIPKSSSVIPNWILHPNSYLQAHLRVWPDYNPDKPSDHFEHCPYVNPMLQPKPKKIQPKIELLPNCSDGRYRL